MVRRCRSAHRHHRTTPDARTLASMLILLHCSHRALFSGLSFSSRAPPPPPFPTPQPFSGACPLSTPRPSHIPLHGVYLCQAALKARAAREEQGWLSAWWLELAYLAGRDPIAVKSNTCALDSFDIPPPTRSQSLRAGTVHHVPTVRDLTPTPCVVARCWLAAYQRLPPCLRWQPAPKSPRFALATTPSLLCPAAIAFWGTKFFLRVATGSLEPLRAGGVVPLDMDGYRCMFGTTRVPGDVPGRSPRPSPPPPTGQWGCQVPTSPFPLWTHPTRPLTNNCPLSAPILVLGLAGETMDSLSYGNYPELQRNAHMVVQLGR
jgi:hypothetical protein